MAVPLYVAVSTDTGCFVYGNTTADTHRTAAALMETGIPAAELNKRHFRTKTLKRLRIESRIVEGMELFDGGETAVAAVDLAMVAQLGADERDLEDIASFVGQVEGVKNAITIRELRPGTCKLSLRTDPEVLNASRVCALLGGGGHAAASRRHGGGQRGGGQAGHPVGDRAGASWLTASSSSTSPKIGPVWMCAPS